MNIEELNDALDRKKADFARDKDGQLIWEVSEDEATIFEVATLVDNGKRIRWCTQHGTRAGPEAEECMMKSEWPVRHECVIVDAIIVIDA